MTEYLEFLSSKQKTVTVSGFTVDDSAIHPKLFKFQRDIVRWALQLGRGALFEECGLGKTFQQLEWARHVQVHTGGSILILAPLAVSGQTIKEGVKLGIEVQRADSQDDVTLPGIYITNYERLHLFDATHFHGVVLDESSILKSFTGKTKRALIDAFEQTPYKLACTATPAPNDHMELGNHAEFLNMATLTEMLARWFINDSSDTGTYRLKSHAAKDFWRWLTSWAVCISRPGDLGSQYEIADFDLPELVIHEHRINAAQETIDRTWAEGRLIIDGSPSSTTIHKVKRESLIDRVAMAAEIASGYDEPLVIWCDTNYEADALIAAFPDAIEVRGSHTPELKEKRLAAFSNSEVRQIITKPDIAGFGLNWQHCARHIFVGVSFSFEKTYQALRRSYRFGQTKPVNVHMIYSEAEGNVLTILDRKQQQFSEMQTAMNEAMQTYGLFRDSNGNSLISSIGTVPMKLPAWLKSKSA